MYGVNYLISGGNVNSNIIPFFSANNADSRGRFYFVLVLGETGGDKNKPENITYRHYSGTHPKTRPPIAVRSAKFVTHEFMQFIADSAKRHAEIVSDPKARKAFLDEIIRRWPDMAQLHRTFYEKYITILHNNKAISFDDFVKDSKNVSGRFKIGEYAVELKQGPDGTQDKSITTTVFYNSLPAWNHDLEGFVWKPASGDPLRIAVAADPYPTPYQSIYETVYNHYIQNSGSAAPFDIQYGNDTLNYTPTRDDNTRIAFAFNPAKLTKRRLQDYGNFTRDNNEDGQDENDDNNEDSDSDSDSDSDNKFRNMFKLNNGVLVYADNDVPVLWRSDDKQLRERILNSLGADASNCMGFGLKDADQCNQFMEACFAEEGLDNPTEINKCIDFIVNNNNFDDGSDLVARVKKISLNYALRLLRRIGIHYKMVEVNGQKIKKLESIHSWQSRLNERMDISPENVNKIKKEHCKLNFFSLLIQLVNAHPSVLNKDYRGVEPCDNYNPEEIPIDELDIYSNYIPVRVDLPYGQIHGIGTLKKSSGLLFGGATGQNIAAMLALLNRQRSHYNVPNVPTFIVKSNTMSPSTPFNRNGPMYGCKSSCNGNITTNMGNIDIMNFSRKNLAELRDDDEFDCRKIKDHITNLQLKLGLRNKKLSPKTKAQIETTLDKFAKIKKKLAKFGRILKDEEMRASVLNDNTDAQISFKNKSDDLSKLYNLLTGKYENSKSNIYSIILALEDAVNNIGKSNDKDYTNDGKTFELRNNDLL